MRRFAVGGCHALERGHVGFAVVGGDSGPLGVKVRLVEEGTGGDEPFLADDRCFASTSTIGFWVVKALGDELVVFLEHAVYDCGCVLGTYS